MKQMTLAATRGFEKHNRATRKAEFLARMDRLMPWAEFCAVIEPHYPKAGNGRPPVELERMHGEEARFYGASAYRGKDQRKRLKVIAPKAKDFTNKRTYKNRPPTDAGKETNRRKSSVRSKVEHPFLTLKRLWGFAKVRYRGLAKNANRAFAMLAMLNVSKWGRPLTGPVRPA